MQKPRLGVNIDHVATLRQARGEVYPSVVKAAKEVIASGAEQITMHLREDRRHIQDHDMFEVKKITDQAQIPLNFEMGANADILAIACEVKPQWVCLVPEKREEKTTEGGLDLLSQENFSKIKFACEQLKEHIPNLKISLFVEANIDILKKCIELGVDAVEIHTGDYAIAFNQQKDIQDYLTQFECAYNFLADTGIGFHAGHGLTDESLRPLVDQGHFSEYNIGHWIISQSVFEGLKSVVKRLNSILEKG
ncbi:MAG: pyridoxine 5'-phosphate synthase [Bacteriovoracaceae bacterium]|jgi:pyridoxine 5-phosphate synthase|nr:pyridoxine 5'-phosphate synthase [Halobacteriovoraceae bacterium]MDP7319245.1 pyridoxine 5'-phosphate synthase [Bacteriovoracaceae bacterium]|tara:strand:- start:216 stop:965 length:750 start_codon:yes stop_codon:yes gene_type:complete